MWTSPARKATAPCSRRRCGATEAPTGSSLSSTTLPSSFGDDEKMVLRTFAIQAAIALDNRRLMREKDQMAVRDGLTGAYNRSYLELTLERTEKELRRNGGVVSILFVDLDGLKKVNDNHGHQAGDRTSSPACDASDGELSRDRCRRPLRR